MRDKELRAAAPATVITAFNSTSSCYSPGNKVTTGCMTASVD